MNDNKQVSLFQFRKQQIRVVEIDGALWFIAADVCRALDLSSLKGGFGHHLKSLAADEVTPISKVGVKLPGTGMVNSRLVSESGLYKLIMRSDKPEAKTFQDWVTREVLPSIRKNGGYVKDQEKVATGEMSGEELALKGYEALLKIVDEMKARAERAEAQVSPRGPATFFRKICFGLRIHSSSQNPPVWGGAHISAPIRDPRHTLAAYLWRRGRLLLPSWALEGLGVLRAVRVP